MAARYGLIGLAVMGENLALNIEQHGFPIAVYNRTAERTRRFAEGEAQGKQITPTYSIAEFIGALERPRRIILMVQAGRAVDAVLDELKPHLVPGDVVIDGGNSLFVDTQRRYDALTAAGIHYFGMGVSGGEEGARWGPSIMPGGPREAYPELEPMVTKIAAQVADGPCVTYIGPGGSGHYVKMVHNGIEYGDMQLIAETYNIMKQGLGLSAGEMSQVFKEWNTGPLDSYLIEIAAIVLAYVDPDTGQPLVDLILDEAEQKGTGRWTAQSALELGVPIPTIDAAVWSRTMSAMKELRVEASKVLQGPSGPAPTLDRATLLPSLADALYASKISSYAQGMALLRAASDEYGFGIHYDEIARIWKGGCIIRAQLLNEIQQAYRRDPALPNLMLDDAFTEAVNARQASWRQVVQVARQLGVPCPALSASLDYYESLRSERLPANLVQAQRDYFGAHTYRRIDKDGVFHTQWEPKRTGPEEPH